MLIFIAGVIVGAFLTIAALIALFSYVGDPDRFDDEHATFLGADNAQHLRVD